MGTAGPLAARAPHGNVTRSPGTQGASGHRLGRRGPAPCEPQLRDGSCPSAVRGAGVRPLRPPVPRKLRQARHGMPGQGRAADERPQVTLGADVQRARSQQEPRARALTGHRLLPDGGRGRGASGVGATKAAFLRTRQRIITSRCQPHLSVCADGKLGAARSFGGQEHQASGLQGSRPAFRPRPGCGPHPGGSCTGP